MKDPLSIYELNICEYPFGRFTTGTESYKLELGGWRLEKLLGY